MPKHRWVRNNMDCYLKARWRCAYCGQKNHNYAKPPDDGCKVGPEAEWLKSSKDIFEPSFRDRVQAAIVCVPVRIAESLMMDVIGLWLKAVELTLKVRRKDGVHQL